MSRRLVVIGGDAAGMSAASQARKRRGPDELEIVAFERGRHTSYSACGIPYWISGAVEDVDKLVSRTPEQHRRNGIDVRHAHRGRRDRPGCARRCAARDLERRRRVRRAVRRPRLRHRQRPGAAAGAGHRRGRASTACRPSTTVRRCAPSSTAGHVQQVGDRRRRLHRAGDGRGLPGARVDVTVVDRSATPVGTFDPDIGRVHRGRRPRAWASSWCCPTGSPRSRPATTAGPGGATPRPAGAARGPGRARAGRAPERRARPRGRDPARAVGRHRGRPPDAHPGRGGVGGG